MSVIARSLVSSTALLLAMALLLTSRPATSAVKDSTTGCDRNCLAGIAHQYQNLKFRHRSGQALLAADAVVRENTASISDGDGTAKLAQQVLAHQDLTDATSGNVYSWSILRLGDGRVVRVSERLEVKDRRISESETLVKPLSDPAGIPSDSIAPEQRSSRTELIKLANGYFEALGMLDPGAAKLAPNCVQHGDGEPKPCLDGLGNRINQQAIERRFPVVIPELGVVIGYAFVMHHERSPPEDDFLNVCLKIKDGSIVEIDSIDVTGAAPGRSGFSEDIPEPGMTRGAAPKPPQAATVAPVPHAFHVPGLHRLRMLIEHGSLFDPPSVPVPKPPYPGITDVRDIAYGPDPEQRLDILAPSARASRPRTVLVFVHGGAWTGGDKHFEGDGLYENVVLWAAQHGMVAVNLNYRLANYDSLRNLYPSQEQDVAAAVDWLGAGIASYGGDPARIFLWGHSSGGSTIAGYASNPMIYGATPGVKGIFLFSAPLEPTAEEQRGEPIRYFGTTHQEFVDHAPLRTLLTSDVPVLYGYSPHEDELPPELEQSRRALCSNGRCPRTVFTKGSHNDEIRAVGSADNSATDALLDFMASIP